MSAGINLAVKGFSLKTQLRVLIGMLAVVFANSAAGGCAILYVCIIG